jgi:hypothetical protein
MELVPVDYIEGEIVDETCACGKPGRLIKNPYESDVNGTVVMEVMCEDCEQELIWAI